MINELWLLGLLPLAALSGWWFSVVSHREAQPSRSQSSQWSHYILGLQFILNEESDKAIDLFIKMLEVDSETVETHLALGSLFRRRGEVNRAIRIHQNLIARPALNRFHRGQAILALATDYFEAGMLDRAEQLFSELTDFKEHGTASRLKLLEIYEQEHEWDKAIETLRRLMTSKRASELTPPMAHYYCELATQAIVQGESGEGFLKRALKIDPQGVRANLMLAEIEIRRGNGRRALRYLEPLRERKSPWLPDAVPLFQQALFVAHKGESFPAFLRSLLAEFPHPAIALSLATVLEKQEGLEAAAVCLTKYLQRFPSLAVCHRLLSFLASSAGENSEKGSVESLRDGIGQLLQEQPAYRCTHCGFTSQGLHWQCPSCLKWGTIQKT